MKPVGFRFLYGFRRLEGFPRQTFLGALACHGELAVELKESQPLVLVITDYMTPWLSGNTLAFWIKHSPLPMPVIRIRANGDRLPTKRAGVNLPPKPFQIPELRRAIRKVSGTQSRDPCGYRVRSSSSAHNHSNPYRPARSRRLLTAFGSESRS